MRCAARAAFVDFSAPLEGVVSFLYLDIKGLVTIAIGNLVDPVSYALSLPLKRQDGSSATQSEIATEWHFVKGRTTKERAERLALAQTGGMVFGKLTKLRLTPDGIQSVVCRKLDDVDAQLVRRFGSAYEGAPADGQLALLSLAWAAGAAFKFPKLAAAVMAGNFETAATECALRGGGTIVERNARNKLLFKNAHHVQLFGLDRDRLYWPQEIASSGPPLV